MPSAACTDVNRSSLPTQWGHTYAKAGESHPKLCQTIADRSIALDSAAAMQATEPCQYSVGTRRGWRLTSKAVSNHRGSHHAIWRLRNIRTTRRHANSMGVLMHHIVGTCRGWRLASRAVSNHRGSHPFTWRLGNMRTKRRHAHSMGVGILCTGRHGHPPSVSQHCGSCQ